MVEKEGRLYEMIKYEVSRHLEDDMLAPQDEEDKERYVEAKSYSLLMEYARFKRKFAKEGLLVLLGRSSIKSPIIRE